MRLTMKQFIKLSFTVSLIMFVIVGCGGKEKIEVSSITIPLDKFEEMAPEYVDKTISTTGIVDHVCKHGGKKLLLVTDDYSLHVYADERYDDSIVGTEIEIIGKVGEDIIDESTFQKWEEDANSMEEHDRKMGIIEYVEMMRDSLKTCGKDHFSDYYLTYVSHKSVE